MVECVKNGYVDAIATDHAPHTPAEKAQGINGFTGLDLAFATCYTALVKSGDITLGKLSRLMSYNPARLMGQKGYLIEEGLPANLVLADVTTPFIVAEKHIISKSKNSPMLGGELYGTIIMTVREGKITYENTD
jgi:dihydroorotase